MTNEGDGVSPSKRFNSFAEFVEHKPMGWGGIDAGPYQTKLEEVKVPVLWEEVEKYYVPKDRWRIKELIPKEGFVILASVSGERKTWIALEMARCISTGENFLQKDEFSTQGCNVLYLDCENAKNELQRRGKQLGLNAHSEHKLYFFNDVDLNLNTDEGELWLMKAIEYFECGVVFIDTLRAVAGGLKEDKAEDVRAFFNRYRRLKDMGVCVIFLDHVRKPSYFEKKIPQKEHLLGSQDKTASVEVLLMLKAENGAETIEMYQRKNRLAKEIEPIKVLMTDYESENHERRTKLTFDGFIESKETQKAEAKRFILEFLEDDGKTTNDILNFIGREKKIGQRNIRDALRDLTESKEIEASRNGRQNYFTLVRSGETTLVEEEVW